MHILSFALLLVLFVLMGLRPFRQPAFAGLMLMNDVPDTRNTYPPVTLEDYLSRKATTVPTPPVGRLNGYKSHAWLYVLPFIGTGCLFLALLLCGIR